MLLESLHAAVWRNALIALVWGSPPGDGALLSIEAEPPVASEPALQPAQPQPLPLPAGSQPAPQPAPVSTPQPLPAPQPAPVQQPPASTGPVALQPETGVGLLVAGPLTVAVGIPFSFLGNKAWRDNCGPTSSDSECADGSFASAGAHTITGLAYIAGISMTAVGGARRGRYDSGRDPTQSRVGYLIGGAVLVPTSLIGMGMVRLLMWLPTPDCMTYECVQQYQNLSTITVGTLALTTSLGAGLLMYGSSVRRPMPPVVVLPQAGRGYSGLSVTGRF